MDDWPFSLDGTPAPSAPARFLLLRGSTLPRWNYPDVTIVVAESLRQGPTDFGICWFAKVMVEF